jgi:CheY-like chemotaxis protein
MAPSILLVDDQRDILRLLRSALNTIGQELDIIEAPSGEEALLEASRRRVDLLVVDYLLPGMNGIELMHKIRARHPDVKVILVTGMSDRRVRDEMLNAGAIAIFDKPIPLADFLDTVERSLGLVRTIFPPETSEKSVRQQSRLSDLLANFRQDINAQAVFLLSDRGRVLARAGELYDSSMEVSLLSALMAIFSAGLKVSKFIHQDHLENYHVFNGGDQDLLFIPVNPMYALLLAGRSLADRERVLDTVQSMLALRDEVDKALRHLGVTGPLSHSEPEVAVHPVPSASGESPIQNNSIKYVEPPTASELENLLRQAGSKKMKTGELDAFWGEAAVKHGNAPTNPDVISYDQARQLGLMPDDEK